MRANAVLVKIPKTVSMVMAPVNRNPVSRAREAKPSCRKYIPMTVRAWMASRVQFVRDPNFIERIMKIDVSRDIVKSNAPMVMFPQSGRR